MQMYHQMKNTRFYHDEPRMGMGYDDTNHVLYINYFARLYHPRDYTGRQEFLQKYLPGKDISIDVVVPVTTTFLTVYHPLWMGESILSTSRFAFQVHPGKDNTVPGDPECRTIVIGMDMWGEGFPDFKLNRQYTLLFNGNGVLIDFLDAPERVTRKRIGRSLFRGSRVGAYENFGEGPE